MASRQRTIVARRAQAAASRGGINGIEEDSRQDNEDTMVGDGYNRLNITVLDGGGGGSPLLFTAIGVYSRAFAVLISYFGMMSSPLVSTVEHPLIARSLTILRDATTDSATFRSHLRLIARLMTAAATQNAPYSWNQGHHTTGKKQMVTN